MAVREVQKITPDRPSVYTAVPQGQIKNTDIAQKNPEYNNWGALGSIASNLGSIGKNIYSMFEEQSKVKTDDILEQMKSDYQIEIEKYSTDVRDMDKIAQDLDVWAAERIAKEENLSKNEVKRITTEMTKFFRTSTAKWGVLKSQQNHALNVQRIETGVEDLVNREASDEEIDAYLDENNSSNRFPGNLDDMAKQFVDDAVSGKVNSEYISSEIAKNGLNQIKKEDVDREGIYQEGLARAQEASDRWNAEQGRNPLFSDLEMDIRKAKAKKDRDYQIIQNDLLAVPINVAIDRLNSEELTTDDGKVLFLSTADKEKLKVGLSESYNREAAAETVRVTQENVKGWGLLESGKITIEQLESGKSGLDLSAEESAILAARYRNESVNRTNYSQDLAFNEMGDYVMNGLADKKSITELTEYIRANQGRISYQQRANLMALLKKGPTTDDLLKQAKAQSTLLANIYSYRVQAGLMTIDEAKQEMNVAAEPGEDLLPKLFMTDYNSLITLFDNLGGASTKTAFDMIEKDKRIEDESTKVQVFSTVKDILLNAEKPYTSDQIRSVTNDTIVSIAEDKITDEIKSINSNDKTESFWFQTPQEEAIKAANNGYLLRLKSENPEQYSVVLKQFLESYKSTTGKEYDKEVRYSYNGVPIFNVKGVDYILDVDTHIFGAFANTKLITLDEGKEKYGSLKYDVPLGTVDFEGQTIMLQTGRQRLDEFREITVNDRKFIVPITFDAAGNQIDKPNELVYTVADTGKLVPIYSDLNDTESLVAEIENHRYITPSEKEDILMAGVLKNIQEKTESEEMKRREQQARDYYNSYKGIK